MGAADTDYRHGTSKRFYAPPGIEPRRCYHVLALAQPSGHWLRAYCVMLTFALLLHPKITSGFELYAAFSPLVTKTSAINAVLDLIRWMKKEENALFILTPQTF